ncbi:MAG: sialidase family protein, partial [Lentisphaeria bacterium]
QDGSKFYRIPGMVTTNNGTLIAIYDIRYHHWGDLSAKIDIGMSRSTDGGNSWEPMQIIMTMHDYAGVHDTKNGVGDPCIVVDKKTGDIIVTALWCHNFTGLAWYNSKVGMKPEDGTGQVLLSRSSDDGKTWTAPINITEQVKDPSWTLILQGPGAGISLKDGTLVIPMQFQDGALNRDPFATIMTSKDHGKTWKMGNRLPISTTEAQVVELQDGSIMINSRKKSGDLRVVATTTDLGKTWSLHQTNEKKEIFPVSGCMSSIIRVREPKNGKPGVLAFCGPHDIGKGRRSFISLKLSFDEGNSWTKPLVLDQISGAYSSMSMVGDDKIAVIYECDRHTQLAFELIPIEEIIQNNK